MSANAIDLGTIFSSIELRLDKLEKGSTQAKKILVDTEKQAKTSAKNIGDAFSRVGTTLSLGLTAPLAALGVAAFKTSVQMDSLKRGLTAVAGSSQEAERQLVRLREVAKVPGLGLTEAIQGSIRLQSVKINAELAERSLKAFGNAIATVGGGKEELAGVTLALQQIGAKGKVFAEEINQINERVPQIREAMKQAFGTADTERLQKLGITSTEFIEKITAQLEKLPQIGDSVKNSMENFGDAGKRALTAIGDVILPVASSILDKLTPAIEGIGEGFRKLPEPMKQFFLGAGGLLALAGLGVLAVGKLVTTVLELKAAFAALTASAGWARFAAIFGSAAVLAALAATAAAAANATPEGTRQAIERNYQNNVMYGGMPGRYERNQATLAPANPMTGDTEEQRALRIRPLGGGGVMADRTHANRLTQLRLAMEAAKTQETELNQAWMRATTNAQRNTIGGKMAGNTTRQTYLQGQLDLFDPEKQKQIAKDALDKRKQIQQANTDAEIKLLEMSGQKKAAAERQADADYIKAVNEGGVKQETAFAIRKEAYKKAQEEFLKDAKPARDMKAMLDAELKEFSGSLADEARNLAGSFVPPDMLEGMFKGLDPAADEVGRALGERMMNGLLDGFMGTGSSVQSTADTLKKIAGEIKNRDANDIDDIMRAGKTGIRDAKAEGIPGIKTKEEIRKSFLGGFAQDLGYEFGTEFSKGMDKLFGKNPLARALSRSLTRMFDSMMDDVVTGLFSGKGGKSLLGGLFGGAGGASASGGGAGAAGMTQSSLPGLFGSMKNNPFGGLSAAMGLAAMSRKGAGAGDMLGGLMGLAGSGMFNKLLGFGAKGLFGLGPWAPLVGLAAPPIIKGIGKLFRGFHFADGGFVPGGLGVPHPAIVHGGEFVMSRKMLEGGGMGNTVHIHISGDNHFSGDYDADRLSRRVSNNISRDLRVR